MDVANSTDPTYSFRSAAMGGTHTFRLGADALHWQVGRREGHIPYAAVSRMRLSYRPMTMQSHRFLAEVWSSAAPKLSLASTSWRSIMEQQTQDEPFAEFVRRLSERVAAAGSGAEFRTGSPAPIYWLGAVLFAGMLIAIPLLIVRAITTGATAGALFIGAFLALFIWQLGRFFWRNQPGRYDPFDIPARVLPGRG